jgi:hypothetical protein
MAESQGLDPRHDPIYQRGYDPAVHGDPPASASDVPTRRARSRRTADEDRFAPPGTRSRDRSDAEPARREFRDDRPSDPLPVTAPPAIAPPSWSPRPDGTDRVSEEDRVGDGARGPVVIERGSAGDAVDGHASDAPTRSAPPWRNPYLIGLVAGGAVLALVGFQMFRSALDTIYVDFAQGGMMFGEPTGDDTPDPRSELVAMQVGWSLGPLLFGLGIAAILAVLVFVAVRWRPSDAAVSATENEAGATDSGAGAPDGSSSRP